MLKGLLYILFVRCNIPNTLPNLPNGVTLPPFPDPTIASILNFMNRERRKHSFFFYYIRGNDDTPRRAPRRGAAQFESVADRLVLGQPAREALGGCFFPGVLVVHVRSQHSFVRYGHEALATDLHRVASTKPRGNAPAPTDKRR